MRSGREALTGASFSRCDRPGRPHRSRTKGVLMRRRLPGFVLAHEQVGDRELVLLAFVAHDRERPRLAPDVEAPLAASA